jgi:hypothetical protein
MTKKERIEKRVKKLILALKFVDIMEWLEKEDDRNTFRVSKRNISGSTRKFPS